jgi:mono/diheme cytochrome c family protein
MKKKSGAFSALSISLVTIVTSFVGVGAWFLFEEKAEGSRADPKDAQMVALGQQVYEAHCASCHGDELQGQSNWRLELPEGGFPAPPHDESGHTWHHADGLLFDYTKRGGQALAGKNFQSNMPGFEGTLSDHEIWSVLAYIKSTWPAEIQNQQAKITAESR